MEKLMRKILVITFFLCFITTIPNYAQVDGFLQKYQESFAKHPQDLVFELHLKENKQQFRQGEIIELELSFSSSSKDKFGFNTASYDRSGRLMIDGFAIDKREGVVDPLKDYFTKGFSTFMMGGLHSTPMLEAKPQIINYELNEWLRFDKVGKYRLYINSGRVTLGKRYVEGSEGISVVSNIIEFEIITADKKWQKTKLAEIVKNLNPSLAEKTRIKACQELRFLGTENAAKEIIKRFMGEDDTCNFDFYMGLQGSPQRKFVIAEMERMMDRPEFPVTSSFLQNMALLSYFLQNPAPLPTYTGQTDEATRKAWQAAYEVQRAQKQTEFDKYTDRLEIALKEKKGKALAVSTDTFFSFQNSEKKTAAINSLIKVFRDLPRKRQQHLLAYNWKKISDPLMLPILREIHNRFDKQKSFDYEDRELFEIAIKRIYELAPNEGEILILAEMNRSKMRISNKILMILPEKELPEFENIWIEKASNLSLDFSERAKVIELLEKFGSINAFPRLRTVYEERIGQIPCQLQENIISYFLKHNADVGVEAIKKSINTRAHTKCYYSTFKNIPQKYWSKEIEQIAVSSLNHEDIEVVKSAVEVLGKNGSVDVKEKIWQRFEQFSQKMKSDASALQKTFGDYNYPIQTIENSFIQALTNSKNWKLDEKEKAKLLELCVSKTCQNQLNPLIYEISGI
jgi:hypothetical protein